MQSNIVISILGGCGMWCLYEPVSERVKCDMLNKILHAVLGIGAVAAALFQIVSVLFYLLLFWDNLFIPISYAKLQIE